MAYLNLRPHRLDVDLFPGGKGVIPVELLNFPTGSVVNALVYVGSGVNANQLSAQQQPTLNPIDDQNWQIIFEASKTRQYDSNSNPYSLDILVNDEVLTSGILTSNRETRLTETVTGEPLQFVWKEGKIVLTPQGVLPQAYFSFAQTPAVNGQLLDHNLNSDNVEFVAFDANGERLYEVTARPYANQLGFNARNTAILNFPVGVTPAEGYMRPFNQ